jgi:hypothetical protein
METLSKFFFKSITILATTFTTYSFLNWLFPVAEYNILFNFIAQAYIFGGITLGIIIAWYVVEEFVKESDLETVSYVALIVAITTYAPVSFTAQEFFEGRALKSAHIEPYDNTKYHDEQKTLQQLINKKSTTLQNVVADLNTFEKSKNSFIDARVYELNTMKYKTTAFKERAWGTSKYIEYEKLISGFNSPTELATHEYSIELKRLQDKVENEKKTSIYTPLIATQTQVVTEISVKTYNQQVQTATTGILPVWAFLLIFTAIGYAIEMLSALPLIIQKRIEYQRSKKSDSKKTNTKDEKTIYLPAPKPEPIEEEEAPELTMQNLLHEKFKGVGVGETLNGTKKLPWGKSAALNNMNKELHNILEKGGIIEGSTHKEVKKSYLEALHYVNKKAS